MTERRVSAAHRGTARRLANLVEIPPQLAGSGGDRALAAMMAIKHGIDAGSGGLRMNYLTEAQQHIARIDPARHRRLVQHLQANVVALGGRGTDNTIAHVTPGEVVVPARLQTPEVMAALEEAAEAEGIDLAHFQVGSGRNSINPNTGEAEFQDIDTNSYLTKKINSVYGPDLVKRESILAPYTDPKTGIFIVRLLRT